jgi:tartrate-resistant acid phosphatase type 5
MNPQKTQIRFCANLLIFLLLLPGYILAQANSFNFLYISDMGGKGGEVQTAVARQMGITAQKQHSKFVITGGDNYHGSGIDSEDSPRWITEFENVYSNTSLQIPWYPCLGNHDNRGNPDAEIKYSSKSKRWVFPARYYTHTYKLNSKTKVLFVHLDTSPLIDSYRNKPKDYHFTNEDPQVQLRWLDSVLSHSDAKWKFVIGHHPVYSSAPAHGDTKELIKNILPILTKNDVNIYFCGHDHTMQHLYHAPIDYFICGGGSGHRDVEKRDDLLFGMGSAGFISCTVTSKKIAVTFINEKGDKLYSTEVK